jgi:AcrR family transcriptional regulator
MPREYHQRRRAEKQADTRRRIVEAAVGLHTTIGPAQTTDAAIAARAGVTRRTFYRHFANDVELFRACRRHGMEALPPPDVNAWRRVAEPAERLRVALTELYAYYGKAGAGLVAIIRDEPLLRPEVRELPSSGDVLRTIPAVLLEAWSARGRASASLAATLSVVTSIATWQVLTQRHGLPDEEAVALLCQLVGAVATPSGPHRLRSPE